MRRDLDTPWYTLDAIRVRPRENRNDSIRVCADVCDGSKRVTVAFLYRLRIYRNSYRSAHSCASYRGLNMRDGFQ